MLKRRIIPIELFDEGRLWKTVSFSNGRDVGDPVKASQVYSDQDADELLLLNISRKERSIEAMIPVVEKIAQSCFVPLTVGGGIQDSDDAARLFDAGADKIVINSLAYRRPELISEIANIYGNQAVVVGIDVRRINVNDLVLHSNCGVQAEGIDLVDHIQVVTECGAGEILVQSIDRDGTMGGYDLELIEMVVAQTSIPVICAGGAGDFIDLKKAFDAGVDGAACGSLFNFGDNSPLRAKAFLKNYQIALKRI